MSRFLWFTVYMHIYNNRRLTSYTFRSNDGNLNANLRFSCRNEGCSWGRSGGRWAECSSPSCWRSEQ